MAIEPQETNWGALIGWVSGVTALTIGGIGWIVAFAQGEHLYVAGFTACMALVAYVLWRGSIETEKE